MSSLATTRDEGPAVERELAADLARRSLPVAPVLVAVWGAIWGWDGVSSAGYAIALVVANFAVAAWSLSWAARISLAVLMAVALGGYVVRMAMVAGAVLLVINTTWIDPLAVGLALIVTHLGLLGWELRYVSASLAFPGLRPTS